MKVLPISDFLYLIKGTLPYMDGERGGGGIEGYLNIIKEDRDSKMVGKHCFNWNLAFPSIASLAIKSVPFMYLRIYFQRL